MQLRPFTALALAAFALSACADADARSFAVSTDAQLAKAIADAQAGDRIQLAPGSYGPVKIVDRRVSGGQVTVTGSKAAVSSMQILQSAGWTVEGLEFAGGFDERGRIVRVENSQNIRLIGNLIRGQTLNNDPWDDRGVGLGLRSVEAVEVRGNRFREVALTLQVGSSRNVSVIGNSIAYVREGINWVGVTDGVIRCNRFSHFFPNYAKKEHPDAIQAWQNQDGSANGLLIEGNFINLGGPRSVHGMLLTGTLKPEVDPRMRLRNVIVRDNIYYGSALHGISLHGAENVLAERNTVLGSDHVETQPVPKRSADGRESSALVPKIRVLGETSSGRIANNIATSFSIPEGIADENNLIVQVRGNDRTRLKSVFAGPPAGPNPPLEAFAVRPGSAAEKAGQGARLICGAELPPAP